MLVHLISLENENIEETYKTIRKELEQFDKELLNKREIIVLTKTDLIDDKKQIDKIIKKFTLLNPAKQEFASSKLFNRMKKKSPIVIAVSLYDDNEIKLLRDLFIKELVK